MSFRLRRPRTGGRYWLQHTTRTVRAIVGEVTERIDVSTLDREPGALLWLNDIGRVRLRRAEPIFAGAVLVTDARPVAQLAGLREHATASRHERGLPATTTSVATRQPHGPNDR